MLVPGLTDDPDNMRAVAEIVKPWKNVTRFEVLPFHQMGTDKWDALGLEYKLRDVKPPSPEHTDEVRQLFRNYGFNVF